MKTPSFAAVAACALLAVLPSAAQARRAPCTAPKGAFVIAADRQAQVYLSGSRYYGCFLSSRRRTLLGRTYARTTVPHEFRYLHGFKLAGRFVAFVDDVARDPEVRLQAPRLVDLRSGKVTQAPQLVSGSPSSVVVQSVTATARGTLAWVGDGRAGECGGLSLHTAGPAATDDRTLDCGPVAEVSVLGGRIYWMRDDQPHTALVT